MNGNTWTGNDGISARSAFVLQNPKGQGPTQLSEKFHVIETVSIERSGPIILFLTASFLVTSPVWHSKRDFMELIDTIG